MKKSVFTLLFFVLMFGFAKATTWVITSPGLVYSPDSITITLGDTVDFQINGSHDALEVSLATWNSNQNTPLAGGFSVPFGGGLLTGLTVGTHYYVCTSHASSGMKGKIVVAPVPPSVVIPNVWINEIHYDNNGTDTLEGYEIAGPAGTNLACFRVTRYTGAGGGIVYSTDTLSGIIPNQACGYGTVWFGYGTNSLQNGPDGLALSYDPQATGCAVNNVDTIIQFLSYEGSFSATNGRARGLVSTNIGVAESASTPIGFSLQLGGVGTTYASLTWQVASAATPNAVNNNQFFCGAPQATYSFRPTAITVGEGDGTVIVGYVRGSNVLIASQTVEVAIKSGSGNAQDINNYTTQTFTFTPGGVDSFAFSLTITDDAIVEGTENIVFALRNPSANGLIGADSLFTLTITDNDVTAPVLAFQNTTAQVSENVGSFTIEVTIANANSNATSVNVMLMNGGTATLNTDYSFTPATLTFPANSSTSQFVTVNVVDDNLIEGNESFQLMLMNPTNAAVVGSNDMVTVTIEDNDTLATGACSDLFFSEYIEGTSNNKALEIYNPTPNPVNLSQYKILRYTNGGLTPVVFGPIGVLAPGDVFVVANTQADTIIKQRADTLSGLMTFDGNDAIALLHLTDTIDVIGVIGVDPGATGWAIDTGSTKDHTLIRKFYTYQGTKVWSDAVNTWKSYGVNLFDSLGAHHTAPCGAVPPATVRFVQVSRTVSENVGSVSVVVETINPSSTPADFIVARDVANSTATPVSDFTFSNTPISNGQGTKLDTVVINVVDDNLIETSETVVLHIINPSSNVVVLDSVYTLTIQDNDVLTVSFNGAAFSYVEDAGTVKIKVIISSPVPNPTSVTVSQTSGSATTNVDYFFADTTITFAANSTDTIDLPVAIVDDNIAEGNEQINFNLLNPTNGAILGISGFTLTIIDNDSTVGVNNVLFEKSVAVYPNPTMSKLNVKSDNDMLDAYITDIAGAVVIGNLNFGKGLHSLDVSMLNSGMYFIHLVSGANSATLKFTKQE